MSAILETTSPLSQKFQAFYELLTEFTQDAGQLHGSLAVHDDASRAAFNSLSRIMGFSDQLHLLVSLMREDVRVIEELTNDPVRSTWTEEIEHSFYDWIRESRSASNNVH